MTPDPVVARLRAAGCVWADDEAALLRAEAGSPAALEELVRRREAGEPLERVVGWAALGGVRVPVAPGVFVPRRRSELLVREAVRRGRPGDVVVDLCCGTGAVGLAVATALGGVELHAADVSPAAVAAAREALAPVGGQVHLGDLDAALPPSLRGRVGLLVAVAPYVPTASLGLLPAEARWEPREALDGGDDGLRLARRLVAAAPAWLAPGGHLLTEVAPAQAAALVADVRAAGLAAAVVEDDDLGAAVVVGTAAVPLAG